MLCALTATSTRVVLLGRLSIDRADGANENASLPGRRAELVFAYLAAEHRRVVSRDELADALWPDRLPDSWAAALRGVISEVRRFLENCGLDPAGTLVTEHSGYRLRLPADVAVDLDEAREGLATAREELAAGRAAAAAAGADRAAGLTGLPFLPHHEGEWIDRIRGELEAMHTNALELQVHALAECGDLRAAAVVAARLVRAEPYSEAAHQLRIGVLADADDRAGAIKAYEHCRDVLAAELGVPPSADTEATLRRALARAGARPPTATATEAAAAADDEPARGGGSPPAAAATIEDPLARLSVLVVEDHPFQRRTALRLLSSIGVGTLASAPDGVAALQLLAGSPSPDVIICDIDMPGMDGAEFIRRVAERGLASAVAIASGLDRRLLNAIGAVGEGHGLQVLGALEKPLTARRLSELLATYRPPLQRATAAPAGSVAAKALVDALGRGAIAADFQPIVDLCSGRVGAAQLSPCWSDLGSPPIASAQLVAVLEREGLTAAFVDRLAALLCGELGELDAAGQAIDLWIALPDAALADATLADRLAEIARASGADPRRIVCVLGARAMQRDGALHVLTRLRVKGFGLCLDELGSRPVTAQQLDRIPLTAVRLDAQLVSGAYREPARVAVLQEWIDLAATLELPVVGNGCVAEPDFELLLQVGCAHGQGAFIAEPMAAAQLAGWAGRWSPPLAEDQR